MAGSQIELYNAKAQLRTLGEQLNQETSYKEVAETAQRAYDKAADRAAAGTQGLAEQTVIAKKLETRLADVEKQLELANAKIAGALPRPGPRTYCYRLRQSLRCARCKERVRSWRASSA